MTRQVVDTSDRDRIWNEALEAAAQAVSHHFLELPVSYTPLPGYVQPGLIGDLIQAIREIHRPPLDRDGKPRKGKGQ